jgi:hypothetical protein
MVPSVVGKHPDLLVGPPTSTVFPTNGVNLNQNIDQKADIWSKPSKDRKFFANSGYWGRRQIAKNGFIEVF